ncbi:hypothetical protein [Rickettsia oklahomensis]|uniref:Uncharacterized protein n=1 Tax=Rickettsia oklahomensis TaxID=3141789 RepID=A0AAU7C016_9RICK
MLTKGKVILADLVDDKAILYAMHINEEETKYYIKDYMSINGMMHQKP